MSDFMNARFLDRAELRILRNCIERICEFDGATARMACEAALAAQALREEAAEAKERELSSALQQMDWVDCINAQEEETAKG